jgi:hypothetical protein
VKSRWLRLARISRPRFSATRDDTGVDQANAEICVGFDQLDAAGLVRQAEVEGQRPRSPRPDRPEPMKASNRSSGAAAGRGSGTSSAISSSRLRPRRDASASKRAATSAGKVRVSVTLSRIGVKCRRGPSAVTPPGVSLATEAPTCDVHDQESRPGHGECWAIRCGTRTPRRMRLPQRRLFDQIRSQAG